MSVAICNRENCDNPADFVFYPNSRRVEELALYLCLYDRDTVLEAKKPKQQMYDAVNALIRKSIVEAN